MADPIEGDSNINNEIEAWLRSRSSESSQNEAQQNTFDQENQVEEDDDTISEELEALFDIENEKFEIRNKKHWRIYRAVTNLQQWTDSQGIYWYLKEDGSGVIEDEYSERFYETLIDGNKKIVRVSYLTDINHHPALALAISNPNESEYLQKNNSYKHPEEYMLVQFSDRDDLYSVTHLTNKPNPAYKGDVGSSENSPQEPAQLRVENTFGTYYISDSYRVNSVAAGRDMEVDKRSKRAFFYEQPDYLQHWLDPARRLGQVISSLKDTGVLIESVPKDTRPPHLRPRLRDPWE